MRILLTGGAGFIGSHLYKRLEEQGHEPVALDNLSSGRLDNLPPFARIAVGDCRTPWIPELLGRHDFSFIYHLASTVGVSKVLNDPAGCIENIIESTKAVLSLGVPGIYFSTSEVYGQNAELLREDSAICLSSKSRWSYACAKLCGEWMALQAGWKVVRLFNVIGPRQSHESGAVVPTFVRQALAGEPITIYGDGSQKRTFINVEDCVEILDRLRDKAFDILNIGGLQYGSITAIAFVIKTVLRSDSEFVTVPYSEAYPQGFEECPERRPDLTKLHSIIPDFQYRTLNETILSVAKEVQCDFIHA